jgi:hypothetical protein
MGFGDMSACVRLTSGWGATKEKAAYKAAFSFVKQR